MTDTAQPETAAENGELTLEEAANAFKTQTADTAARDERGRFAPAGEQEIEAEAGPDTGEDDAESHDDGQDDDEAADEAQPTAVDLPTSWAADKAEIWEGLPPDVQAYIAQRDGELISANNAKFQEAANARKQAEAIAAEASNSRTHHLAAIGQLMELFESQAPDPDQFVVRDENGNAVFDQYSYEKAKTAHSQSIDFKQELQQQRGTLLAQQAEADFQQEYAAAQAVNQAHFRGLVDLVPDLGKPDTADKALSDLADYAVQMGMPAETFQGRRGLLVTALEWQMLAESREYRRLQQAKAKVRIEPKPAPKPQPNVRPGVSSPRSAQRQAVLKGTMDRLSRTGSIEDAAAMFKQLSSRKG